MNNVINRLMCSNNWESGASSRRRRRLHLRTFAVTCLSEDIGILEWVPDTDSLRNLVMKSYNPQTSESCPRRRGNRLANFSDANLRSYYEMCQNKFFKEGNLSRAASLFEDHCLRPFPPLLWWWFQQTFHDPHAWYEARNRFTLSAAAVNSSALGVPGYNTVPMLDATPGMLTAHTGSVQAGTVTGTFGSAVAATGIATGSCKRRRSLAFCDISVCHRQTGRVASWLTTPIKGIASPSSV